MPWLSFFKPFFWSYLDFYNNCLISRALIGSFLSSIRVRADKILIYASFQVQHSGVKLSTFQPIRFYRLFKVVNQKARKAIYNVHVILNRINLSLLTASLRRLSPSFIPGIWPFWGLVIVKKNWLQFFMRLPSYWR